MNLGSNVTPRVHILTNPYSDLRFTALILASNEKLSIKLNSSKRHSSPLTLLYQSSSRLFPMGRQSMESSRPIMAPSVSLTQFYPQERQFCSIHKPFRVLSCELAATKVAVPPKLSFLCNDPDQCVRQTIGKSSSWVLIISEH